MGARCLRLYKNFQAYNYHSFSFESFGFDLRLTRRTTKAIQEPGDVIYVMNLTNIKPDTSADEYSKSQQFILRGRREESLIKTVDCNIKLLKLRSLS